jgi:GNAT superfamily N-acetyltransferase
VNGLRQRPALQISRAIKDSPEALQVADVMLASRRAFLDYAVSPHTDTEIRAWVRGVLFDSEEVFVAAADGVVIAMMSIQRAIVGELAVDWLNQMYVLPEHVGRGTGSALLEVALKSMRHSIRLFTFQQNADARRFYERHGFKAIAFSDGHNNEERCPDVLYEFTA